VLNGRDPKNGDLNSLSYAYWILKETLRKHPPVETIPKISKENVEIDGKKFEKGTLFGLFVYGLHYNPEIWENPHQFIPERFSKPYDPSHFIPFSYGKRNCIGFRLAEIEATLLIAMIIQKYSFEFKEGIDVESYFQSSAFVTTFPVNDLPFVVKKRK
jgi:cytochrome P450